VNKNIRTVFIILFVGNLLGFLEIYCTSDEEEEDEEMDLTDSDSEDC